MDKQPFIIAGAVLFLVLSTVFITALVTQPANSEPASTNPSTTVTGDNIMSDGEIRRVYMDGCTSGDNEAFCGCTYDYMVNTYGTDGLVDIALDYSGYPEGELPAEMTEAVYACINEL